MKAPFVLGRLLFGGFFLHSGITNLRKAREMGPYLESKGIPKGELAVRLSSVPLILGGASMLLGVKPKLGAMAILGFLAGASPLVHDFWRKEDPAQRANEMVHLLKNLALAGGALALMGVDEPWEASLPVGQHKLSNRMKKTGRAFAA